MFSASPNVSKFIGEDLSSIQKIITESLKDNRSLEVKAVNEMMKIQLESLLESIRCSVSSAFLDRNIRIVFGMNVYI
jgi:hypothetical protein